MLNAARNVRGWQRGLGSRTSSLLSASLSPSVADALKASGAGNEFTGGANHQVSVEAVFDFSEDLRPQFSERSGSRLFGHEVDVGPMPMLNLSVFQEDVDNIALQTPL
jgi:hypothetical protein